MRKRILCLIAVAFLSSISTAQADKVVFMEPASDEKKADLPVFRLITDPDRLKTYKQWIDNDAARWAFDLHLRAWKIAHPDSADEPLYYIALVPEGNHAEVGFKLLKDSVEQSFPKSSYIKLDPDQSEFKTTLLHETGHMVLAILNGGTKIPQKGIASIPHTTAALTDRGTAFDEGFAIHLETLAAHFLKEPEIQSRYNHQNYQFGVPLMLGEYHRIAGDLLSYAQTATRYTEVRENDFAFAPAYKGPDYFRAQLETRDFSELRDANQLLQSEGFYASFFFSHLLRGNHPVFDEIIAARQNKMLEVLADIFRGGQKDSDTPFLLVFVEHFLEKYPDEGKEVLDVLLDLSHGVFVDRDAAALWRQHYLEALRLNLAEKKNEAIETARERWRKQALNDPKVLYSLLGPQIAVEVPGKSILLVAFEESAPLAFDVNTAEEGVLLCIPDITKKQVESWIAQRRIRPFITYEDFKTRSALPPSLLRHIKIANLL